MMDPVRHRLTTSDNPWNPWTQFDEWYAWDQQQGYNTLAYQARVVRTSNELPDSLQLQATEQAIDDIIEQNNVLYRKVAEPSSGVVTT